MDRIERLDDREEGLRLALDAQQAGIWTALPGVVVSVNLPAQTVVVQPTIQGQVTAADGTVTAVNLPLLVDVPICWPRAGGYALTLPVTAGDEVLVVFSSRCLDAWWQQGGIQPPVEPRMHDLSDGFAILSPTSQPRVLTNVQTDGIELRDVARSTYIKLSSAGITILGNVTLTGNLTQLGNQIQTGSLTVTGAVTTVGTLTNNAVDVGSPHVHSQVKAGTDLSGPPQ